jgi:hypothetical protein
MNERADRNIRTAIIYLEAALSNNDVGDKKMADKRLNDACGLIDCARDALAGKSRLVKSADEMK